MWEKSAATGQKQLNVYEQQLPLYDEFYTNRVTMNGGGTAISQDQHETYFAFTINDLRVSGTEMEQVLIQVWKGNELSQLYDEIDVTERVKQRRGDYCEIEDKYKVALAAGLIEQTVSLEQFAIDNGYKPNLSDVDSNSNYSYTHAIRFAEDYPELKLDGESAKELSSRLIIKFKDGYTYTEY